MSSPLQIAIDGPAASGKTTVARRLAARLNVLYLDTGAMYRALAYLALRTRIEVDSESALVRLLHDRGVRVELDPEGPLGFRIFAGGSELDDTALHSNEVTTVVSAIAKHPKVRAEMVDAQRAIADATAVVMAGRDIGTVVLPNAAVKVFLDASVPARVDRRHAQLAAAGVDISAHRLTEEIEERDRLDRNRAVSPLAPAADAYVIDSSDLSVDDVVNRIYDVVLQNS